METTEINLEEILLIIKRRKYTILSIILLFVFAVFLYNAHQRPVYKAISSVRLPGSGSISITTMQGITTPWNDVPTQLAILKSINIRKRVIEKLNMIYRIYSPNAKLHTGISIDSIRFTINARPTVYLLQSIGDDSFVLEDTITHTKIKSAFNRWTKIQNNNLSLIFVKQSSAPEKTIICIRNINSLLKSLGGRIKIQQENNSFIAKIEAKDYSPDFAKKLADAYAEAYVDYTLEDARYSAKVLKDFLEIQVKRIETQLKEKEDSLSAMEKQFDYFSALMIKDGEETNKEVLSKYLDLISQKYNTQIQLEQARSLMKIITKSLSSSQTIDSTPDNNIILLKNQLISLEQQKLLLSTMYSSDYPEIKNLERKIRSIKDKLGRLIKKSNTNKNTAISSSLLDILQNNQLKSVVFEAQLIAINNVIKDYENRLSKVPDISLKYFNLKRKIDALKEIYENLLLRLEETKIEHASQIPDARVLDYALVPTSPVSPNKLLNFYFALILGLIIGFVFAILKEHLDRTIKDPKIAEDIINTPILSIIPHLEEDNVIVEPVGRNKDEKLLESLNRLKINLEFMHKANPYKILGITSTTTGEGKTMLSLNLAQILANSGYKVLLVNGDLIKPTLNKILGFDRYTPGLSEFLHGETINLQNTPIPNLKFLPSGKSKGYVSAYLLKEEVTRRFKKLIEDFDYVIFDTAPVGAISDTLLFASYLFDSMLIAIKHNYTNSEFLVSVIRELERNDVNIVGGVFNDYKVGGGYGYKFYYYGYYYGHENKGLWHAIEKVFKRRKK